MCIVEIRPGRGGRDAEEFAGSIARAISAWSIRHNQPASTPSSGTRSITITLPRTPVMALR
ncbi:MAG: PCRF domain-containing protein [Actinobacteria bacterium]|nr:PCRF domain-containing protein [Actinomycetota bacterium]